MIPADAAATLLGGVYVAILLAAAWSDLRTRRIPNWLTMPATAAALLWAVATGRFPSAAAGAVFAAGLFILPMVLYGAHMAGGGDVKLAAFVGAALGFSASVTALMAAGVVASAVVIVGLATARISRRQKLPFGPFIAIGGIVALIAERVPTA